MCMACPARLLGAYDIDTAPVCSLWALASGQCLAGEPSTAEGDKSPYSYTHSPQMQLTPECAAWMQQAGPGVNLLPTAWTRAGL